MPHAGLAMMVAMRHTVPQGYITCQLTLEWPGGYSALPSCLAVTDFTSCVRHRDQAVSRAVPDRQGTGTLAEGGSV